jgi:hypothetical protein
MAMFTTIDGARIAFTGDAFFNDPNNPLSLRHNLIYRNQVKSGDHLKSIRNVLEFEPNILAPGHGRPFLIDRETAENFAEKAKKQDAFFSELIAGPAVNMGLDPSWISIYPYQLMILAGQTREIEIRVRNYQSSRVQIQAALVLPQGWRATPARVSFPVEANAEGKASASVAVPANWSNPLSRVAIALDVMLDDQYLGQITEAVVDVRTRNA